MNIAETKRLATRIISENNGNLLETIENLHTIREEINNVWSGNSASAFLQTYDDVISEIENQNKTLTSLHSSLMMQIKEWEEISKKLT